MAETNRVFKIPFKYCPECGVGFYFDEKMGKERCRGCGLVSFKVYQRYIAFYARTRSEHFKEYHHGD